MPNITSSVWLCCCCCAVNVVVCAVNVVVQCDHMLRLFAQHSGPFTVKKIALNQVNWTSGFKILPNIIYALKRIQKTLKILPKWRYFAKSGHIVVAVVVMRRSFDLDRDDKIDKNGFLSKKRFYIFS